MQTNETPRYDASDNPTGCCPRFNPAGWDGAVMHFEQKPFVRARTHSVMHVPIDMGRVFGRVQRAIAEAGADRPEARLVLSRDLSPYAAEHLFAVDCPVPGEEMTTLSGDFRARVFEGAYAKVRNWHRMLAPEAAHGPDDVWFFYTTCPKCARVYGRNHVVGVVRTAGA